MQNLFEIYLPLVSEALIFDGSTIDLEKIASRVWGQPIEVLNHTKWEKLKELSR